MSVSSDCLDYQFSAPTLKKDNRWYWSYNSGLQAQSGTSCSALSHASNHDALRPVFYRSTDSTLPSFPTSTGQVSNPGEVFFDVSVSENHRFGAMILLPPIAKCTLGGRHSFPRKRGVFPRRQVVRIRHISLGPYLYKNLLIATV